MCIVCWGIPEFLLLWIKTVDWIHFLRPVILKCQFVFLHGFHYICEPPELIYLAVVLKSVQLLLILSHSVLRHL